MLPPDHPARRWPLELDPLPSCSTHGLPLANGLLGVLVWREGDDLVLSLDRADLWDLRSVPEYERPDYTYEALAMLVETGDMDAIQERFEAPYRRAGPTKLPAGRIRFRDLKPVRGRLDPADGSATISGPDWSLRLHVDAERPAGFLLGTERQLPFVIEPPAFGEEADGERALDPISPFGPEDLGYPKPVLIEQEQQRGYVQTLSDGSAFCVLVGWKWAGLWQAAWTIALGSDADAAVRAAQHQLEAAFENLLDGPGAGHSDWWDRYWSETWLKVPDPVIERQWVLDAYKFGASARGGCPPVSLQAQWTADNGRLPPWKGDYHHDLNTQMTYWPCLTGNRLDAHRGFLDWLWNTRPACRDWTRRFFGVEGLNVPMTADIGNRQLGGWAPYTHSATTGAWLAHHFAEHVRMSGDEAFLRDRAWPYVRECATFLDALTRMDALEGRRRLRLSSSPEIGDNRREAWFPDWTNYDLMLTRTLFGHAMAMAARLGEVEETARWGSILAELPVPALNENGAFAVAPQRSFTLSHRHFSHQILIHPLGGLHPADPCVGATIADIDKAGTAAWMGYSFAWSACLHAFAGNGEMAAERLHQFAEGFTAPNSFHTNGEVGPAGLTLFNFDVFTLEGNCAAMAAVQNMVLQSRGDAIELFPAVPADWQSASFAGLLAEGGVTVDAQLDATGATATLRAARAVERRVSCRRGAPLQVRLAAEQPFRIRVEA